MRADRLVSRSKPAYCFGQIGCVYFPADGNFYSMGGRTSDLVGSDFQHVLATPRVQQLDPDGVTLPTTS